MTRSKPEHPAAPDQAARDRILTGLDTSMLVEAAAGTGKTTITVGRMVNLLAEGKCQTDTLAAVTFTRKAASELRTRFQLALEKAAAAQTGPARARLEAALDTLDRCYIGTIHSFCSRILRERPIEAGVLPGFTEIEQDADDELRRAAWEAYAATLIAGKHPLLDELHDLGLHLGDLREAFLVYVNYPDVEEWPAPEVVLPDLDQARGRLAGYLAHIEALLPQVKALKSDKLIPRLIRIVRRAAIAAGSIRQDAAALLGLLEDFDGSPNSTQGSYPGKKEQKEAEEEAWNHFRDHVAQPLLADWRAKRYAVALRALHEAQRYYDSMRQAHGGLNFQDLLMKTAQLLRSSAEVRGYFQRRYTHVLVDEFQDTDPVQAEVMLLLTADRTEESDWRKGKPRPGSLFVVGDPKQSIYRFRRADIGTYNLVKRIILESGGEAPALTANFRSHTRIVEWVNRVFADPACFPPAATDASPAYVAFDAARIEGPAGELQGIRRIDAPDNLTNQAEIAEWEADLIARSIREACDRGRSVQRAQGEIAAGAAPGAHPGDYMILAFRKERLSVYARKLQEYGLPHHVTGGSALNETRELRLLQQAVGATLHPDDPVQLVGALRSGLFGVSDATLHGFVQAGGQFDYRSSVPPSLPEEAQRTLHEAFDALQGFASHFRCLPMAAALERIAQESGLLAQAAAGQGGDMQAGAVARAIELLRKAQRDSWTLSDVAHFLAGLATKEEGFDAASACAHAEGVVRIMNLHQAKGLEAPVVFLADPSGFLNKGARIHVNREGDCVRGYLAIREWGANHQGKLLAAPRDWEEHAQREDQFLEAERTRLRYVAATRARAQLVIIRRAKRANSNFWAPLDPALDDAEPLADVAAQPAPPAVKASPMRVDDVDAAAARRSKAWAALRAPSYVTVAAKTDAVSAWAAPAGHPQEHAEHAAAWGTIIHLLLETAMRCPGAGLECIARAAFETNELPIERMEDALEVVSAVQGSELWGRALAAPRRFVEVPFELVDPQHAGGKVHVLRGVIDLVFEGPGGWVIVDYKTDRFPDAELEAKCAHYGPQLDTYARAWRLCSGADAPERGLFFTQLRRYIRL